MLLQEASRHACLEGRLQTVSYSYHLDVGLHACLGKTICFLLGTCAGENGIPTDMLEAAADMYTGLQYFFRQHKDLQQRPLFITGESYAGKYVPAIGALTSFSALHTSCHVLVPCAPSPSTADTRLLQTASISRVQAMKRLQDTSYLIWRLLLLDATLGVRCFSKRCKSRKEQDNWAGPCSI